MQYITRGRYIRYPPPENIYPDLVGQCMLKSRRGSSAYSDMQSRDIRTHDGHVILLGQLGLAGDPTLAHVIGVALVPALRA